MLLDYIYPQCCGICGKLNPKSLCKKCEIKLSKNAIYGIDDYRNTSSYFDEHIYIFTYEGEIRNLLINYKFNDKAYIYRAFVSFLEDKPKICVQIKKYDIIIPVPISKKRYKQRGYNQSGIFAKGLARNLQMACFENILIKKKDNIAQSSLSQEQRENNVKNVYKVNNAKKIIGKNILIVDDIFTTGSTLNECSKMLKYAGAKNIGVLTIAKD